MEPSKKVSVLICNFNTKDILKKCLENLFSVNKYNNIEVIVADSGSTDGSVDMLREDFPHVTVVESQNNGLAAGLNSALSRASGEYLLYLGSDGFPEADTLGGLVEYFETHSQVGAASVKLVLRDGKLDKDAHRGFPTPWASFTHFTYLGKLFPKSHLFGQYFLSYEDMSKEHEIDSCITHFLFVRKSTQDQVGQWDDERFFLYGEDIDMCYRIKQAGWKIMYLPQFTAQHWKGVTVGRKESSDIERPNIDYDFRGKKYKKDEFLLLIRKESTNSMKTFYKKHYQKLYPAPLTWLVLTTITVFMYGRIYMQAFKDKVKKFKQSYVKPKR